ncbi:uncharacterized protein LOC123509211 isoform X3 [Portunus trituberculatus]|uniref:uncharacterized protein LOC123509211 isoform X3 n=1 Tax=Portunus trituberculatus TaxID=210409 RepID=UPI001E1CE502|nr:uncharacterized protein LOC123509211 isoform X3 [Portunus trituberculatus]
MSGRSVQQGAVYTTRDKVGSCRPSPKHGASKSRASVRRWSTTRHKSGTGVPTTAQLRITNFVEAHVFHSLQKMTQTEEACGSAQVWAGPFHRLHEAYRLSGTVLSRVSFLTLVLSWC